MASSFHWTARSARHPEFQMHGMNLGETRDNYQAEDEEEDR
jgi:hypothetical protein